MNPRKSLLFSLFVLSILSCTFVSRLIGAGSETPEVTGLPETNTTSVIAPEILNYPRPDLQVQIQPFTDAGCSGENPFVMECSAESPLHTLGCDFLSTNNLVGGLDPSYAVATCLRREVSGQPPEPSFFQMTGCLMPLYQSVVISLDGEFRLVNDPDDFQAYFAPIESENEALSYAQLVTGLSAVYGRDVDLESSPYHYRVDRLEDTHVAQTEQGFLVSLFSGPEPLCGCGTHTFYQRDVLVSPDGQVEILESTPIYDMDACID